MNTWIVIPDIISGLYPRLMPELGKPIRAKKYPQKNKNMTFYLVSVRDPEEGMNNFGPCTQDCPNRKAGCSASREAWSAVRGERLRSYGRRAEIIDISQMTDGGARNCRRAARWKRKIGGEM